MHVEMITEPRPNIGYAQSLEDSCRDGFGVWDGSIICLWSQGLEFMPSEEEESSCGTQG